jgi:hypothetical protein
MVAEGLEALGYQPVFQRPGVWTEHQAEDFDVVVTMGTRLHSALIRDLYQDRGVPVLVLDLPPIRREGFWALWPYKINIVPTEAPPDRLGLIDFKVRRERGEDILVLGQKAGDAAHGMDREQIRSWFGRTLEMLVTKHPKRRVVWRPHPQYPIGMEGYDNSDPRTESLDDALENVGATVTFNSTAGIRSILDGIPTFVNFTCFYRDAASGTKLPAMDKRDALPPRDTLEDFFSRLTHCVWSEDELRTPAPYAETLARMEAA